MHEKPKAAKRTSWFVQVLSELPSRRRDLSWFHGITKSFFLTHWLRDIFGLMVDLETTPQKGGFLIR